MTQEELLELIAEQFRVARVNASCDPSNCKHCDCHLDNYLREMIHSQSEAQARFVIGLVEGFIYGFYGKSER